MSLKSKLQEEIAEMQSVYNDADTPSNVKELLEPSIQKAKEQLAQMEAKEKTSGKKEPKTKAPVAAKKTTKATGQSLIQKAMQTAMKYRKDQGLSASKSDIERDAKRSAKPAGKRVSASGNTYFEQRENRVDRARGKYPKLADGGRIKSATNRDRAYKSDEKWEQDYERKTTPLNPKYEKREDGGMLGDIDYKKISYKDIRDLLNMSVATNDKKVFKETITGLYNADRNKDLVRMFMSLPTANESETIEDILWDQVIQSKQKFEDGGMLGDATNDFRFDITSPMFAQGGVVAHGFRSGDIIYEIYKGYGIIEAPDDHNKLKAAYNSDVVVINPNTGDRHTVERAAANFKDAVEKARTYIDTLLSSGDNMPENDQQSSHLSASQPKYDKGGGVSSKAKFINDLRSIGNRINIVQLDDGTLIRGSELKFKDGGAIDAGDDVANKFLQYIYPQLEAALKDMGLLLREDYSVSDGGTTYHTPFVMTSTQDGKLQAIVLGYETPAISGINIDYLTHETSVNFPDWDIDYNVDLNEYAHGGKTPEFMSLQEYVDQKNPVKDAQVLLSDGEYVVHSTIKEPDGKTLSLIEIKTTDPHLKEVFKKYRYVLVNNTGFLYTMDETGNPLKPSVFYISKVKYADGGATFSDKVKAISKKLSGSAVAAKYKAKYGSKYSPKEAKEAATKIAGAMVSKAAKSMGKPGRKPKNVTSKVAAKYAPKK